MKIFIFNEKCFYIRWVAFLEGKPNFFHLANYENLKFLKNEFRIVLKFRSSIKIMFRRKVDIKTFNFEKNN